MGIKKIERDVEILKEGLLEKKQERFSRQDVVRAFFGALLIGITFLFSGGLIGVAKTLSWTNVGLIIVFTVLLLVSEIYFIGWSRVRKEKGRNVFEFTLKRLLAFYIISMLVSVFYVYIFGINSLLSDGDILKLIFMVAMPCSIGAAIGDLLRKY